MSDGSSQGPSSTTIQAALAQLASLDRLLDGLNDQGGPLFPRAPIVNATQQQQSVGVNASASSSGGTSRNDGAGDGLLDAVPSILSPLLQVRANRSSLQLAAALTRQAPLFRPRNFQAISSEVLRRLSEDGAENGINSAAQAARLAQQLLKQEDAKEKREKQTRRILEARAARKRQRMLAEKAKEQQQQRYVDQASAGVVASPLQDQQQIAEGAAATSAASAPDTLSFPDTLLQDENGLWPRAVRDDGNALLERYLAAWRASLLRQDPASASTVTSKLARYSPGEKIASIQVDIECVGRAFLHIILLEDEGGIGEHEQRESSNEKASKATDASLPIAQIESLTLRAPSEAHSEWESSRFPLYRKLSSIIQARAYASASPSKKRMAALTETLFCLAALRTLYEAPPPLLVNVPPSLPSTIIGEGTEEDSEVIISALRPADAIGWPVRWAYCQRRSTASAASLSEVVKDKTTEKPAEPGLESASKLAVAADDPPESATSELFSVAAGEETAGETTSNQDEPTSTAKENANYKKANPAELKTTHKEPVGLWRAYHIICASGQ